MKRNYTGMTIEEQNKKLSELQNLLDWPKHTPTVDESYPELQPVVREVDALEELIRETSD